MLQVALMKSDSTDKLVIFSSGLLWLESNRTQFEGSKVMGTFFSVI